MLDEDLLAFIRGSIRSVWALEVLLRLRREPERMWETAALAQELRATERLVGDVLTQLETAGLAACEGSCEYRPASPALDALCARLAAAYAERPAAVTRAIMSTPNEKLQIFADAFRFKGKS